ncbi:FAD-dependent thymidylate synthase [Shinella zoogloeoides]|uniref:FAD-dependent thymidylate synthase n=1 Tax=Shinella zoogloeoides TaxID=352475 RepID=UPI00299E9E5B|nr:FAD-dependent thymidylate synthase [Shinella zoogloeoides]WPE19864.1 hypothetical protein ShzoTeo12_10400 [Shinella zoogloeoides]
MTTVSAKTVLRSRNASAPDNVLSTLLLRYPRFIHAEFMTHRALSRNAASSRAIPVKKIIDDILADTAMPLHWGADQRGMQAFEECSAKVLTPIADYRTREEAWYEARDYAIRIARAYEEAGYHKQVVNRLLEPFMHITVLVSATEWDNFLELRDHKDAEPHIQMLAREIRKCLDQDPIQTLEPGGWHLPFVNERDLAELPSERWLDYAKKLSVARCAGTSYKTVDGFDMTIERAVKLHDKLVGSRPMHASPCEQVAQADAGSKIGYPGDYYIRWENEREHANFVGFRQYRHQLGVAA